MAEAERRIIKARYAVKGPRMERVDYRQYYIDENGALQFEEKSEEMECYMVLFPQGHSIRVTSYERLKEMGYHLKPRMVDMNTGDVVDVGGDPYDFANEHDQDMIVLDEKLPKSRSNAKANAADLDARTE